MEFPQKSKVKTYLCELLTSPEAHVIWHTHSPFTPSVSLVRTVFSHVSDWLSELEEVAWRLSWARSTPRSHTVHTPSPLLLLFSTPLSPPRPHCLPLSIISSSKRRVPQLLMSVRSSQKSPVSQTVWVGCFVNAGFEILTKRSDFFKLKLQKVWIF